MSQTRANLTVFFLTLALWGSSFGLSAEDSPRDTLERARTARSPAEAIRLLESNLASSAELKPYFIVELARSTGLAGDWAKSLSWSERITAIPEPLADRHAWWRGQALERLGRAAEALAVYRGRIASGRAADPDVYRAYFRIADADAGKTLAIMEKRLPLDAETAYLAGICAVRAGEWAVAERVFAVVLKAPAPARTAATDVGAWASFYRAWSLYRLARWKEAIAGFSTYLDMYPAHERVWQAAGAAALAAIQSDGAALPFAEKAVRLAPGGPERAESLILLASVQMDARDLSAAEKTLTGVADGSATNGETPLAPRSLFMLGEVAFRRKDPEAAEARWRALLSRYPRDPLAEEAVYRSAEQWYVLGDWSRSAALFMRYRELWNTGRFASSVLASGGEAIYRSGKKDLAILWWEEFLKKHTASPAYPRVMSSLVRAYAERGEYAHARTLARDYRSRYPAEAAFDGMDGEIARLERLERGESAGASALAADYERLGKSANPAGRERGLELAREYLADFSKRAQARAVLLEIVAKAPLASGRLPRAERIVYASSYALLAESYREGGEYRLAAQAFLSAGTYFSPIDGERAAESLYGATDCFLLTSLRGDAEKTMETLDSTWPDSVWTRRARMLITAH